MSTAPTSPQQTLLTAQEAADRLNVSLRTLRTRIAAGQLPVIRFSARCLRIRSEDLDAYVRSRRRRGVAS